MCTQVNCGPLALPILVIGLKPTGECYTINSFEGNSISL